MSVFFGDDDNGNAKLVISKNTTPLSELVSTTTLDSNIIFNSQLPYMAVDFLTTTNISKYTSNVPKPGTTYGSWYYTVHTHYFTAEELSVLMHNGEMRYFIPFLGTTQVKGIPSNYIVGRYCALYNYTSYILYSDKIEIYSKSTASQDSMTFVVFPFTDEGTPTPNAFDLANSITIGDGDFLFDDKSIFKANYLVEGTINQEDLELDFFGTTYQVINSVPSTGAISFSCDDAGVTEIKHGDKVVLSSLYTYTPVHMNNGVAQTNYVTDVRTTVNEYLATEKWTTISGFNFAAGGVYVVHVGVIATRVVNPQWYYSSFMLKADGNVHISKYTMIPEEGAYILKEQYKTTPTSYLFNATCIIDETAYGPQTSLYTGPYTFSFTYYRVA